MHDGLLLFNDRIVVPYGRKLYPICMRVTRAKRDAACVLNIACGGLAFLHSLMRLLPTVMTVQGTLS